MLNMHTRFYIAYRDFNGCVYVRSQSGIETQSLLVGIQFPSLQIRLATDEPSGKVKCSIQDMVHVLTKKESKRIKNFLEM